MWNQKTDRMFLDLREDAVLIFALPEKHLLYLNDAARALFPDASEGCSYESLIQNPQIDTLVGNTITSGKLSLITLDNPSWFDDKAILHCVKTKWDETEIVALTIDRRAYGAPTEAFQMMKAVLSSAYCTALRINLRTMRVNVINDKNPLMNTQATFRSFSDYVQRYAECAVHPEDRQQFLTAFAPEQLRLFLEANTTPACTVRRLSDEEYRWASFTLTAVTPDLVLLFGKDSNELHLQQERSNRYQTELHNLSLRNEYIISSTTDIFRLMLHIDLRTGETLVCEMQDELLPYFSYDAVYQFSDISSALMTHVHPDDKHIMSKYTDIDELKKVGYGPEPRLSFEYRRVAPQQDPNINAKWTRSVFTVVSFENGEPTGAVYAVQDIDAQKRKELESKRLQDSLNAQFNTLIENRYLWFIEGDYQKKIARCFQISNHMILPPMECPFGQFFERMIMPHCHPNDYKRAAQALLPNAIETLYAVGKEQMSVDYRMKSPDGWRYVRADVYIRKQEDGFLRSMIYISDINDEVLSHNELSKAEHEQLILRRKFGMMIEDSFVLVAEVDLDSDTIQLYKLSDNDFSLQKYPEPFSQTADAYPDIHVHPDHRELFRSMFSYEATLKAVRENVQKIKHLFLIRQSESTPYKWCNVATRCFRDANGKVYLMLYIEDVDDEICKRDSQLHELIEAKEQLADMIRDKEKSRIRKAHVFMNIASNFQLALNQIYATLDKMEHNMPESEIQQYEFRSMFSAYERLSAMTETAKDVLLLENNQLPLLSEPTDLAALLHRMKSGTLAVCTEKHITVRSLTTHVLNETVYCDSARLSYMLDNIFVNVMRSLPNGSDVTLQLAQMPVNGDADTAVYEFSLITKGDRVSQDIQSGILSPIPEQDPLSAVETDFLPTQSKYEQQNLYLSKRLIRRMNGTLKYVRLPDHAGAVIVRLPFRMDRKQAVFPLRYTFGKRAIVWDSQQHLANAMLEMMRETGMRLEWQADYESLLAYLRLVQKQNSKYDIIVVRQSNLSQLPEGSMEKILELAPESAVIAVLDENKPFVQYPNTYYVETPLFRSALANELWKIFPEQS